MKGLVACWFYQVCIYFHIPVAMQMCGLSLGLSWLDLLNEKFRFLWRHFCTLPSTVQAVYIQHFFTWPYKVSSPFGMLLYVSYYGFFFSLFCSCGATWNEQSDRHDWIHLLGIFQPSQSTEFVLPGLPGHLSDNSFWEHTHNNGHQGQSCPPHPNVLFPQQPEFLGHLLHIYHCPRHAGELLPGEEDYLLWGLPFPDFLPCDLCWHWGCIIGSYGLRPLCSHLPPSSISSPYECESLCLFGVWVLAMWTGEFYDTHSVGNHTHSVWA